MPKVHTTPSSQNLIANWLQKRRESREAAIEKASIEMTEDTASNEQKLIDILSNTDFIHSQLPEAVLNDKKDPSQTCCNLERICRGMVASLKKENLIFNVDVREIDKRLITLANSFRDAVKSGDSNTAYTAKSALHCAIFKLRPKLSQSNQELAGLAVKAYTEYLDSWITLVEMAHGRDELEKNIKKQQDKFNSDTQANKDKKKSFADRILNDSEFAKIVAIMKEKGPFPANSSDWSPEEKEIHTYLLQARVEQVHLELDGYRLQQNEDALTLRIGNIETMYSKVYNSPIVEDPNLLNKYHSEVESMMHDIAAVDVARDKALEDLDKLEGNIKALKNSQTNKRLYESDYKTLEKTLNDIHRQQQEEINGKKTDNYSLGKLGILSEEELEKKKQEAQEQEKQRQAEEDAQAQEAQQAQEDQNSNENEYREQNYN